MTGLVNFREKCPSKTGSTQAKSPLADFGIWTEKQIRFVLEIVYNKRERRRRENIAQIEL